MTEHYDAFLYGAGDDKIGSIVGKGKQAGKMLKQQFLAKTPALKKLKEAVEYKVQKHNHLTGLDGRILATRSSHSALNTLLQSAGALIVKKATCLLDEELEKRGWLDKVHQVLHIHDEIQLIAQEDLAEDVGKLAVECFKKAGEFFQFRCPIDGEFKVGRNWAETH